MPGDRGTVDITLPVEAAAAAALTDADIDAEREAYNAERRSTPAA